jgi:NO-binding membrane sensor protein with MHYT domain
MYRVLNCLQTQRNVWLVVLAGTICLLTCFAAVNLFQRPGGVLMMKAKQKPTVVPAKAGTHNH